MSLFTDREYSRNAASPIRLYHFRVGGHVWLYTNAENAITFGGLVYQPIPIADDGIRQTGQTAADTLTLTVPDDIPPVSLFRGHPPADELWLTIRDTHYGLPDQTDAALVIWIGTVQAARWTNPGQTDLICASLSASMGRLGLRLTYERSCPHGLFDASCRINRALWRHVTTVTQLDGASVVCASLPSNLWHVGGFITWTDDMISHQRAIENKTGNRLYLLSGTAGIEVGTQISVYPGCDQTSAMCNGVYNNLPNFGGFRHMPGKSPFDTNYYF
jgi:uncharacterized phage protein (TIGR02218 family)